MDLQLHELGLTLLVGAFGVLTIEAISYFTFDRRLTGFFAGKWGLHQEHARPVKEDPMTLGVVIVLCFCLGLVAEDFCYDFDDVSTQWLYRIPFINLIGRYVVHDLRKEQSDITHVTLLTTTIVRNLEAGEPRKTDSPNVTPLGYSLLSVRPFSLLDGERGIDVERWLASIHPDESMDYSPIDGRRVPPYPSHSKSPPLPSRASNMKGLTREDVRDAIWRLWFDAHDRMLATEEYHEEIVGLQNRVNFSRAVAVIAMFAFIASVFCIIARMTALTRGGKLTKDWQRPNAILMIAFFTIYVAATLAYSRESVEMYKRVLNYYRTRLVAISSAPNAPEIEHSRVSLEH